MFPLALASHYFTLDTFCNHLKLLRGKLLNTITHPQPLRHVTLQPSSKIGDVFVSSCGDGILRLFDLRHSVTGMQVLFGTVFIFVIYYHIFSSVPVFESAKDNKNKIWSATFPLLIRCSLPHIAQQALSYSYPSNSFRYTHRLCIF